MHRSRVVAETVSPTELSAFVLRRSWIQCIDSARKRNNGGTDIVADFFQFGLPRAVGRWYVFRMAENDDGFGGLPPLSHAQLPTPAQMQARQSQQTPVSAIPPSSPQPPPKLGPEGSIAMAETRAYREFTIPTKVLGQEWPTSGFEERHLTFGITEIAIEQQIRAGRLMGAKMDVGTAFIEQQLMCLYTVGGEKIARNRDYKLKWLEAIGPGGRDVVEHCWNKINTVTDGEKDAVYQTGGEIKRG